MPISSVFIFLMLHALYRLICKNSKSFFCKNSLNVQNVKPFSNFFFLLFLCIFGEIDSLKWLTTHQTSCEHCWQWYKDTHLCLILQNEDNRALDSQVNYGVFGNVLVIGGVAAFAFVVRYVLQTMSAMDWSCCLLCDVIRDTINLDILGSIGELGWIILFVFVCKSSVLLHTTSVMIKIYY